ncbi:MAG: hypothetical protein ACJ8OJ_09765 [Povalibacter sp.]
MCPDIDLRANAASGAELALAMMMYLWLCAGCAENFPANSLEAAPMTQAHHSAIPADLESAVIKDVARRSGKQLDAVSIILAESVTWSDGSLGCPEPGMLYTQALVRGYRVVATVGDQRFEYHAGLKGPPKFCPADRVLPPSPDDRV